MRTEIDLAIDIIGTALFVALIVLASTQRNAVVRVRRENAQLREKMKRRRK